MSGNLDSVHTGHWINYAKGNVYGSTITLSNDNSTYLSSFLAIFVTWAGGHLWGILTFVIHQLHSTRELRDGLHHQRQATLRNDSAVGTSLWNFTKLMWTWRKGTRKPFLRTFPFVLMAATHLAAFTAAGIFSSQVTRAGEEALLVPSKCGIPGNPIAGNRGEMKVNVEQWTNVTAYYVAANTLARSGLDYSRSCYQEGEKDRGGGRRCQDYTKPTIGQYQAQDIPCPFHESMCDAPSAFQIDTGYMSSDEDLGLNTRPEDRMWFRRVTTWSPIKLENHWGTGDGWYQRNTSLAESWRDYYLGSYNNNTQTFSVSNITSTRDAHAYTLTAYEHNLMDNPSYTPIPELYRSDADVIMLRLDRDVYYASRVEDPLFRASEAINLSNFTQFYSADEPISVLGFTEQYQICSRPEEQSCGPLTGLLEAVADAVSSEPTNPAVDDDYEFLGEYLSDLRWVIISRATYALGRGKIGNLVVSLGSNALIAPSLNWGESTKASAGLAPDFWKSEAANLHNISLAITQRQMLEWVQPTDQHIVQGLDSRSYFTNDFIEEVDSGDPFEQQACRMQKARTFEYTSFSVLGLSIIVGVGGLVILINLCLSEIVSWWRLRKSRRHQYKTLEWIDNTTLQLQRKAFEARGILPWNREEDNVPLPVDLGLEWTARKEDQHDKAAVSMHSSDDSSPPQSIERPRRISSAHSSRHIWRC